MKTNQKPKKQKKPLKTYSDKRFPKPKTQFTATDELQIKEDNKEPTDANRQN